MLYFKLYLKVINIARISCFIMIMLVYEKHILKTFSFLKFNNCWIVAVLIYILRLTLLVVESRLIPCGDAMVDMWVLFLKTVRIVFIKDDFPDPIVPITMRLMAWHGSGGERSRIFCKSSSFFLNYKKEQFWKIDWF